MATKSSHIGIKTYYVYDRTGAIQSVKTKALNVRELKQDLLGGKAMTNTSYRVILDSDEDITGIYPKKGTDHLTLRIDSHSLVITRTAYFISGLLKFLHRNMQSCQDMTYGIEGLAIVRMNRSAKQFLIRLEWTS